MKTIFNADSHFVIGKMHLRQNNPCQDHALSRASMENGLIVVSDGCSQGGHTDIGARITTCAAMMVLQECVDFGSSQLEAHAISEVIDKKIQGLIRANQHMFGLRDRDLYATCLYGLLTPQGGFVHVLGDGVVILSYLDGTIEFYLFEWNFNEPYYPIYGESDIKIFLADHEKKDQGAKSLTIKKTRLFLDGSKIETEEILSTKEAIKGKTIIISPEAVQNELKSVFICSDGAESFFSGAEAYDQIAVIKEIAAVKVWTGEFVKRRLSRLLSDFSKKDIESLDDISCAAIHINHIT